MCQKLLNLSFGPNKVTPVGDRCDNMLRARAHTAHTAKQKFLVLVFLPPSGESKEGTTTTNVWVSSVFVQYEKLQPAHSETADFL